MQIIKLLNSYFEENSVFSHINVLSLVGTSLIMENIIEKHMLLNFMLLMLFGFIASPYLQSLEGKHNQLHLNMSKQTIKSTCKYYVIQYDLPAELSLAPGVE